MGTWGHEDTHGHEDTRGRGDTGHRDAAAPADLDVLEHVGVVADLAQLHDGVHQRLGAAFALREQRN